MIACRRAFEGTSRLYFPSTDNARRTLSLWPMVGCETPLVHRKTLLDSRALEEK